jgi:predicted PurR-regulated permease PerM
MIIGIKHALLLAAIAAVFELIPIFGPILSAVPAVLMALVDGGATTGFSRHRPLSHHSSV